MRSLTAALRPAIVGLALIGALPAAQADDDAPRRAVTVTASGSVTVEPDQARITSGVTADGATAREALAKNTEAMQKVIAALKEAGIDAKDIQTASFRVEPRYTRPIEGRPRRSTATPSPTRCRCWCAIWTSWATFSTSSSPPAPTRRRA